jgi:uncharacterized membrane protein
MKPYWCVLILLLAWSILIFLTPFLAPSEIKSGLWSFFGYFCHQMPERSISPYDLTFGIIQNTQKFPVCTRDLAFYLFFLVGTITYPFFPKPNPSKPRGIDSKSVPSMLWLVLASVPMAIDGGTQFLGWRESTNLLRLLTGSLLGFVCAYYLIPLVNILIPRFSEETRVKPRSNRLKRQGR